MSQRERKRLFVDPKVQGALMARVVMYWGFSILTISLMLLCWRIVAGPARMFWTHFDDMWFYYAPALVASLLLLPLVVTDVVRMSNRFCGPITRLRHALRQLARGEELPELNFREGDHWCELAKEFNAVRDRLARLESELATFRSRELAYDTLREESPMGGTGRGVASH